MATATSGWMELNDKLIKYNGGADVKIPKLARLCSGQYLYIPKWESIRRNARDREIRALFNGGNYKALALQFDLSERQIYKIISGTRT